MSKGINTNDIWYIIKSLLDQDNKTYLIKHHLESFNDFIENKIPDIISQLNPLSIFHEYLFIMCDFPDFLCKAVSTCFTSRSHYHFHSRYKSH